MNIHSLAEKKHRIQRERLGPARHPVQPVADHIRMLLDAGWTRVEIAERSGVNRRTLFGILNGPLQFVNRHTTAAICALQPKNTGDRVPPVGARRRVQGLAAIGWPLKQTAQDTGLHKQFIQDLVAGRYRRIPRSHAAAIERLSRARFMTPGPSKTARTVAARNGWMPVTAWEDIDNPDEQPQLAGRKQAAS